MRIRTDGEYSHRERTIQDAADRWDVNKTQAVLNSCTFSVRMLSNLERALTHPDMTDELAEVLETPNVRLRRELETEVDVDG